MMQNTQSHFQGILCSYATATADSAIIVHQT